jgi:hypothetical protein
VFGTDARRRLFRNVPDIVAVGDAYEVAGVLPMRRVPAAHAELPEPVHRYRALSPVGYVEKLRRVAPRTEAWARELALAEAALAEASGRPDRVGAFWERVRDGLSSDDWLDVVRGTPAPRGPFEVTAGSPAAARHLRDRWRLSLDDSLAWLETR